MPISSASCNISIGKDSLQVCESVSFALRKCCKCLKGLFWRSLCRLIGIRAPHSDASQYLWQFTPIADILFWQRLRSSSSDSLLVPAVRLPTIGRRAFLIAGARAWNDLQATGWRHISAISAHLQKTTKTASVSTARVLNCLPQHVTSSPSVAILC